MVQALVVVMHRHRQHALGVFLADHIIIQHLADVARNWHAVSGFQARCFRFFADDVHAQFDTFITDEHRRPRDQLADLMLALATERAIQGIFAVAARIGRHCHPLPSAFWAYDGSLGQGPRRHNLKVSRANKRPPEG